MGSFMLRMDEGETYGNPTPHLAAANAPSISYRRATAALEPIGATALISPRINARGRATMHANRAARINCARARLRPRARAR